jgi:hypothetical protein
LQTYPALTAHGSAVAAALTLEMLAISMHVVCGLVDVVSATTQPIMLLLPVPSATFADTLLQASAGGTLQQQSSSSLPASLW